MQAQDLTLDQFFTPPKLARRLVEWAGIDGIPGYRILEPGAGWGAIAELLPPDAWKVEIDPDCIPHLSGPNVVQADFLRWEPPHPFDVIVGNPPYGSVYLRGCETDLDLEFVLKSLDLLSDHPQARVCFLLQTRFTQGKRRYERLWGSGRAHLHRVVFLAERPQFVSDSTSTAMRDFSLFDLRRTPSEHVRVEWWPGSWGKPEGAAVTGHPTPKPEQLTLEL